MNSVHINEKVIVKYLEERKELLEQELRKVEATLSVINTFKPILDETLEEMSTSRALKALNRKSVLKASGKTSDANINPSKKYKPASKFKLDDKINAALLKLTKGNKDEIFEKILEEFPDSDPRKTENTLAVRLSYLLKNNLLIGEKVGRLYTYSLK